MSELRGIDIDEFVYRVWLTVFPKNNVAPKTLCCDIFDISPFVPSGLSSFAHGYPTVFECDPDERIYNIVQGGQYYINSNEIEMFDISKLPQLDCIVFISCDYGLSDIRILMEKLGSNGVVVVVNECIKLPEGWIPIDITIPSLHYFTCTHIIAFVCQS